MKRVLEVIFRHLFQLLALLVLLPLIGVAITYVAVPKKYQATASLWASQIYDTGTGAANLTATPETPATSQVFALDEFLQTRSFALSVVQNIALVPTLQLSGDVLNDPRQLQDAVLSEISKNVQVAAQGTNLFVITYANKDPHIAQQIVQSVIDHYRMQIQSLSADETLLQSYQAELPAAQQEENAAIAAESQYLAAHPNLNPSDLSTDPQYAQLDAHKVQAQNVVNSIQSSISSIEQKIFAQKDGANTLYNVIDAPQRPTHYQSRLKNYLTGGGVGLAMALLAVVLYLVILVRRDRAIYSADDIQEDGFEVPVVMQVPHLKPILVSLVAARGADNELPAMSTRVQPVDM